MKRILFLIFLNLIISDAFADSPPEDEDWEPAPCPTTVCPSGTFMGDDGECYSCDTDREIYMECIGHQRVFQICPNRFTIHDGCGGNDKSVPSATICEERGIDIPVWLELVSFFSPMHRLLFKSRGINYRRHICYDKRIACRV